MADNKRNDQVFQLSLTEIAFTISFILLLLLGYMVFREQRDRIVAETALKDIQIAGVTKNAMNEATTRLRDQLVVSGSANPDEVIVNLIAKAQVTEERDRLKAAIQDLEKQISGLVEVEKIIANAAKNPESIELKKRIISAIALQKELENLLTQNLESKDTPQPDIPPNTKKAPYTENDVLTKPNPPDITDEVREAIATHLAFKKLFEELSPQELPVEKKAELISAAIEAVKTAQSTHSIGQSLESLKKDNIDLRGQLQFYKMRLEARGGRDYPPCWADESGKVEFLFSIELQTDSVVVSPRWPERRNTDAAALPGIETILAGPMQLSKFPTVSKPILDWSKRQDPECRHYVQLKSAISDAVQSDRARLMVENYFYKVEVRR
jgi:hypothetical protein